MIPIAVANVGGEAARLAELETIGAGVIMARVQPPSRVGSGEPPTLRTSQSRTAWAWLSQAGASTPARTGHVPAAEPRSNRPQSELEQIVLRHLDAAYNLARWLVGDPASAEEVVQDAVVHAITYVDSYRGGDGKTWFLKIVRNTAYSALAVRRKAAEVPIDDSDDGAEPAQELADPAPHPEAAYGHRQQMARLEKALAALPVKLRECLVLRDIEQLSYKDIVRTTGLPMGTVMSRLWRARQELLRACTTKNES